MKTMSTIYTLDETHAIHVFQKDGKFRVELVWDLDGTECYSDITSTALGELLTSETE